jgi:DNA polymerase-3 subunit beta
VLGLLIVYLTVQAKTFTTALDFLSGAVVKKNAPLPILTCVKLAADDGRLTLTTCNLDLLLSAGAKATIEAPGVACVPHGRLAGLIAGLPADADVVLRLEDSRLYIKSGRGHWRLPAGAPLEFPVIDSIAAGAATFVLPGAEARRLIERASPAIGEDMRRFYLTGLHVAHRAGKLVVASTDGHRLVEAMSACVDPGLIPAVTLPRKTIELLDEIAATGDVTVRLTDRLVELAGGALLCRSKLIDATFPDYTRVIPNPSSNTVIAEAATVLAAVERLAAVAEGIEAAKSIGIEWAGGHFSVSLSRAPDEGREEIEPVSIGGSGRVAVQAGFLKQHVEALDAKIIRIDHAGGGSAVRIERADEETTVSVIMPMFWEAPYDAADDINKSVAEGFRAIRERKAAGGPRWPAATVTPATSPAPDDPGPLPEFLDRTRRGAA